MSDNILPKRPPRATKDDLRVLIAAIFVVLFIVAMVLSNREGGSSGPSTTPTTSSFGSKKFCLNQAAELHREYPDIYATDQQAYDGCRDAGTLVKQLSGHVDPSTRP